jgi:hypothetical protein
MDANARPAVCLRRVEVLRVRWLVSTSSYVRIVLNIALLAFAAVLALANGLELSATVGLATKVGSALFIVLWAFENFLWKVPWLHRQSWLPVPNLSGTWKGELQSNWKKDPGDPALPPIETYFVIRQTFAWLSIRQYTKESESLLVTGSITSHNDGVKRLVGVYRNDPRFQFRDRSPIHYGGFNYAITGHPTRCLEGHYWTDRKSDGSVCFLQRSSQLADSFVAAQALFVQGVEPVVALPEESTVS